MAKRYTIVKIMFYLVIILTVYPVIASALGLTVNTTPFSIYNTGDNGLSILADRLREKGYDVEVILSSLKILRSINRTGLLVIMAPAIKYDMQEAIALADFVLKGGSVLIVDDFYAANSLLSNIWLLLNLASMLFKEDVIFEGIYFNTTAVLMDVGSYYKTPANPVIVNFNDYYGMLSGKVRKVVTSFPSIISVKIKVEQSGLFNEITTALPPEAGILLSTENSWLETDLRAAYEGDAKPDPWEWGGVAFSLGLAFELPNGGKVMMISDPDIFSNKLVSLDGFDNLEFALSIIKWLMRDVGSKVIFFDEAHLPHAIYDPLLALSIWFKAITEVSSSWIIAPFAPFVSLLILIGYIPQLKGFRPRLFSRVERVLENSWTRSRVRGYRQARNYKQACSILLDFLIYEIIRKYGLKEGDWQEVIRELINRRADLIAYRDKIWNFIKQLHEVSIGKRKIRERDFINLVEESKEVRRILLG